MQRFKKILVVVDEETENRPVVERAVTLALRNQARLTVVDAIKAMPRGVVTPTAPERLADVREPVVDIIEEWPPGAGLPDSSEAPTTLESQRPEWPAASEAPDAQAEVVIREQIVEEESQRLEQWVDAIRKRGIPVEGKVLYGTPFLEIIREVLRNDHDLVMTAAGGHRGLTRRPLGSTTMHLMRKCPCPVWVVRPSQTEGHTRILAAVDPSSVDEEQGAVNTRILDLATALAQRDQRELVVVHTWTFPAERSLRSGYLVGSGALDNWVGEAQSAHRRRLAELLSPYPLQDLHAEVYLLKGLPGQLIPQMVDKMEIGLLVMGTVSRTGVAGLLIGSTAERILRQVECSVLTVKPDGFVTPVGLDD